MRTSETFKQYIWLVNILQRTKKISLERIQKLWIEDDMNDGKPLSRTTFHRIKTAIDDIFDIQIKCDTHNGNQYYIGNPEALKDNTTQNWMLQTLTVNNILIDSQSIKDKMVLETIPGGLEYLQTVINAIKTQHKIAMRYQKFSDDEPKANVIEPYCLKLFHQRWYLLAKNRAKDKNLHLYALDRVVDMEETEELFEKEKGFNASEYFKDYFGAFVGSSEKPQRIVLRAYGKMIPLLRTLPKHHSQKEIATKADYSDFEYFLAPTFDFKQDILKEGKDLEVVKPQSLRREIANMLRQALEYYEK